MSNRYLTLAAAVCAVVLCSSTVKADTVYDFTFTTEGNVSGPSDTVTGTITVNMSGVADAITGSGSTSGSIGGLVASGSFQGNDNQVSSTAPYLDGGGISFTTANQGTVNLAYNAAYAPYGSYAEISSDGLFDLGSFTLTPASTTPTSTPEPSSLALIGAGLLLAKVGQSLKRRTQDHA